MDKIKTFTGEYNRNNPQEFQGSMQDWLHLICVSCLYEKLPPGVSQARALIDGVNLHLGGQARAWAFNDPTVMGILLSDVSPDESVENELAEKLKSSLIFRYPNPYVEAQSAEIDWLELDDIRQGDNEDLQPYHQRLASILYRLGGRDIAHQAQPHSLILQRVVKSFCSGLRDERTEFDVKRQLPNTLQEAFELSSKYERFWKGWGNRAPAAKGPAPPTIPMSMQQAGHTSSPSAPMQQTDPGAVDRAGFPPAKTKECFDALPSTIQELIKRNGKAQMCFKCGETGHYANTCENTSLSRSDQAYLRMFSGLPFNVSDMHMQPRASLRAGVYGTDPNQYEWLSSPIPTAPQPVASRSVSACIRPQQDNQSDVNQVRLPRVSYAGTKRVAISDIIEGDSANANTTKNHPGVNVETQKSPASTHPGINPHAFAFNVPPVTAHGKPLQPMKTKSSKSLKTIKGMVNEEGFDLKSTLKSCVVPISLLQLLAISPNQRAELHRLTSSAFPRKKSNSNLIQIPELIPESSASDINSSVRKVLLASNGKGAFYTSVEVKSVSGVFTTFPRSVIDPGSEINIITEDCISDLGLKFMTLMGTPYQGLYMVTSSGSEEDLIGWIDIVANVSGHKDVVQFFVLPKKLRPDYSLLFGIPWLVQAGSKIDMSTMQINLTTPSGDTVVIQGPPYTPDIQLRLHCRDLNGSYSSSTDYTSSEAETSKLHTSDIVTSEEDSEYDAGSDSSLSSTHVYPPSKKSVASRSITVGFRGLDQQYMPAATYLQSFPRGLLSHLAKSSQDRSFTLLDEVTGEQEPGELLLKSDDCVFGDLMNFDDSPSGDLGKEAGYRM